MMQLDVLTAVSPVDGRYRSKTEALAPYFSEYALMKYRVKVEIEYFIMLCELPLKQLEGFDATLFPTLRGIYEDFSEADAERVKAIESVTNHDVKAIEYFIKEIIEFRLVSYDCHWFINEHLTQDRFEKGIQGPSDEFNSTR